MTMIENGPVPRRKPRVLLTGEFSAGKSTLINGLIGRQLLPTRVVSTAMPPVWLIREGRASFRIDLDGVRHEVASLEDLPVEDTLIYVRSVEAPILDYCDLIDTPGSSDPSIPAECWDRVIGFADTLVWCSGATQAWRQSEKSTCRGLPGDLMTDATLLITQADRMPDARSLAKVATRVERDASEFFRSIELVSCLSDGDIARVQSHLVNVCRRLPRLVGKPLPQVEAVRDADIPPVSRGNTWQVKTRLGEPIKNIFEDNDDPEATTDRESGNEVAAFEEMRASDMNNDQIRSAWLSIIEGRDLTRPDEALECLDILRGRVPPACAAGPAIFRKHAKQGELDHANTSPQHLGGVV